MLLTKQLRVDFVDAVMADVPRMDIDTIVNDHVLKTAVEMLPPEVRALWDSPLRDWVVMDFLQFPINKSRDNWKYVGVSVPTVDGSVETAVTDFVEKQARLYRDEQERHAQLRAQLIGIASTCRTSEALVKALPEFGKYVPRAAGVPVNPVAVASVVTEFVKAGWPAGKRAADPVRA